MRAAPRYRTRLALRLAVTGAALLWGSVLVLLGRYPGAGAGTVLSAAAFFLFFVVFAVLYDRSGITLTPGGVVVSGVGRRVRLGYREILDIRVHPGPLGTLYDVTTRRGPVRFSSLFARHRELFQILRERAGLRER